MGDIIKYDDKIVELTIKGKRCLFAPLRMEWVFNCEKGQMHVKNMEMRLAPSSFSVLQILVTTRCNLRCTYCSHFFNPQIALNADLTPLEIKMLKKEILKLHPRKGLLIISGGEPLLVPDTLFKLLETAYVRAVVFTNGIMLTKNIIKRLRQTTAFPVISLDGDIKVTSKSRLGRDAKTQNEAAGIFNGLGLLAESGIKYGVSMVMTKHNIDIIDEQIELIYDNFMPKSFGVNIEHYLALKENENIDIEKFEAAYRRLFSFCKGKGIYIDQIARRLSPFVTGRPKLKDCSACGDKRVFFPGGIWRNCVNQQTPHAPLDIWSRTLPVLSKTCRNCIAIGNCGGGCIFDGESFYGKGSFDPRYCKIAIGLTRAFLEDFSQHNSLVRTNREALKRIYQHLLYRPEDTLRFSIGHMTDRKDFAGRLAPD